MVRWNRLWRHVRIRNHPGTVRWTPTLDKTGALTHHLFAGEHLRKCQGLALHLPLAHLCLKLFHQFSIDQGQARDRSMAVVRMEIGVPAVCEILEGSRTVVVYAIRSQAPEELHVLLALH